MTDKHKVEIINTCLFIGGPFDGKIDFDVLLNHYHDKEVVMEQPDKITTYKRVYLNGDRKEDYQVFIVWVDEELNRDDLFKLLVNNYRKKE